MTLAMHNFVEHRTGGSSLNLKSGLQKQSRDYRLKFKPRIKNRCKLSQAGKCHATLSTAIGGVSSSTEVAAVALGYVVLAGSLLRSVPQIIRIVKNKSAEGISFTGNVVEIGCLAATSIYNVRHAYLFSTYGDVVSILIQDIIIVALICSYEKTSLDLLLKSFFGVVATILVCFMLPLNYVGWLQMSTTAVLAFGSKVPQIVLNIQRGDSGELSLLTQMLNVIGNTIRVFTTATLTKDVIILIGTVLQGIMNGTLLYQTVVTALKLRDNQKLQLQEAKLQ